ncbi:zinc finger CCCH domain-containing protein 66-like isoform X2 [Hibiscus syriacus]|uniref:Zinc finger CCCH domain-containing protein 66-like isoform X2 n=1 Tax=Hibiscus syriacus TaxID=106335 RepID=A0A6A3A097_HIBSY|nr:zinc finger CCCH domain-containing protein 66-like isoform X2 [Hibiscus syriacus]
MNSKEEDQDIDEPSLWYGRRIGSKKKAFEERTPLFIASIFGCKDVVNYIVKSGRVDVNRACDSDYIVLLLAGSSLSPEVVRILLDASADINSVDANGNRTAQACCDSYFNSRKKILDALLKGNCRIDEREGFPTRLTTEMEGRTRKDGNEKKDYPYELALPDIKNEIYGTDEFRMYTFKIQPCSREYSHDWTECPFVHPGENARSVILENISMVASTISNFVRGRASKDETNCTRNVCFFAHKPEKLRPLYASTGSALPSPTSYAASLDHGSMSPLALASLFVMKPSTLTPPLTPTGTSFTSAGMWPNQSNIIPPTLRLPSSSRLKAARSARYKDLNVEMLNSESHRCLQQHQQLNDEIIDLSSQTSLTNPLCGELNRYERVKPTNLEDIFGSLDTTTKSSLQGISFGATSPQLQSPTTVQMRPNINHQIHYSYPTNLTSSLVMTSPTFGLNHPEQLQHRFQVQSGPRALLRANRIRVYGMKWNGRVHCNTKEQRIT